MRFRSSKARTGKFTSVEIQVRFGQPRRQRDFCKVAAKKVSSPRHHPDGSVGLAWRSVARLAVQHREERTTRVGIELGLGNTGLLKIELIENRVFALRHQGGWRSRSTRSERHAQRNHSSKYVRPQQCRMPCNWCPPVMTGNHRLLVAQRVD